MSNGHFTGHGFRCVQDTTRPADHKRASKLCAPKTQATRAVVSTLKVAHRSSVGPLTDSFALRRQDGDGDGDGEDGEEDTTTGHVIRCALSKYTNGEMNM